MTRFTGPIPLPTPRVKGKGSDGNGNEANMGLWRKDDVRPKICTTKAIVVEHVHNATIGAAYPPRAPWPLAGAFQETVKRWRQLYNVHLEKEAFEPESKKVSEDVLEAMKARSSTDPTSLPMQQLRFHHNQDQMKYLDVAAKNIMDEWKTWRKDRLEIKQWRYESASGGSIFSFYQERFKEHVKERHMQQMFIEEFVPMISTYPYIRRLIPGEETSKLIPDPLPVFIQLPTLSGWLTGNDQMDLKQDRRQKWVYASKKTRDHGPIHSIAGRRGDHIDQLNFVGRGFVPLPEHNTGGEEMPEKYFQGKICGLDVGYWKDWMHHFTVFNVKNASDSWKPRPLAGAFQETVKRWRQLYNVHLEKEAFEPESKKVSEDVLEAMKDQMKYLDVAAKNIMDEWKTWRKDRLEIKQWRYESASGGSIFSFYQASITLIDKLTGFEQKWKTEKAQNDEWPYGILEERFKEHVKERHMQQMFIEEFVPMISTYPYIRRLIPGEETSKLIPDPLPVFIQLPTLSGWLTGNDQMDLKQDRRQKWVYASKKTRDHGPIHSIAGRRGDHIDQLNFVGRGFVPLPEHNTGGEEMPEKYFQGKICGLDVGYWKDWMHHFTVFNVKNVGVGQGLL
ncbi:hypothetical protein AK812_SmicGene32569 [Symbiodinium microadriaticum]|uniref:Uncharacterized protein n=1 Tax=Symbiodinium microadriaticum TaxID=2951 RepID=A0A1Q9CTU1_SYMMI|nr:hypothetical protein AK812_SmicGene32569 [Symbiodinium microadriaticum]